MYSDNCFLTTLLFTTANLNSKIFYFGLTQATKMPDRRRKYPLRSRRLSNPQNVTENQSRIKVMQRTHYRGFPCNGQIKANTLKVLLHALSRVSFPVDILPTERITHFMRFMCFNFCICSTTGAEFY